MSKTILEVNNLQTYFFTGKTSIVKAVDDVSFLVNSGETFAFVGESGSGKSITCRSILRLIHNPGKIINGEVKYNGIDIFKLSKNEMRKIRGKEIGIIFQEPMIALNPVMKIKEQIYEAFLYSNMTKYEKYHKSVELLRLVGIQFPEQRLEEYVHQYSGGMLQRVMIATVLAATPKILIADEPTTALDVTMQNQIIKLLIELKSQFNMSIILVTHDLGVVANMSDRVAVMYAGRIVEMANTLTLFSKPKHPYTIGLLRSIPTGRKRGQYLESINGQPPELDNLPPGCSFNPRCRYKDKRCIESIPKMIEVESGHFSACHYIEKLTFETGIEVNNVGAVYGEN